MRYLKPALCIVLGCLWASHCLAQELSPRLFWPTPKGTKVLVAGFNHASGDMLLAPTLPVENAESNVNAGVLGYLQTLSLWGRTSNILVEVPFSWGTARGLLAGVPAKRNFSGMGDIGLSLNVNLSGAPSMTPEELQSFRANPRPLVGLSLKVLAPTGHYNSRRVVNVGANRWAARLKLGTAIPIRPSWIWELSASSWWFQDDADYVGGNKEQDAIYALESNLIKRIRPGFWASLDMTYYRGGDQTIDGAPLKDWHRNLKLGGTLVWPFARRHAIKLGYATGVVTRYGNDFDSILLSYQVVLP